MEVKFYKLNTKKRVDSLKNSGISVMNQKLILNFVNYYFSEGIGEQRALKYLSTLEIIAKSISIEKTLNTKCDLDSRPFYTKLKNRKLGDGSNGLRY